MKTTNKILLYDDYCPLCTWYSGLFVKFGLLNPITGLPSPKRILQFLLAIDIEKGKDEIPLFDPATRQTLYGIDSLLGNSRTENSVLYNRIGNFKPVKWFLRKLYKLISYNRKVIVARKCGPGTFDCSPAYNSFLQDRFPAASFLYFNSTYAFAPA